MNKVNIIGTIFGQSGYDVHTRSLANALNDLGLDVSLDVSKPEQWERLCNDFEYKACNKKFDPNCTSIMISQPQFWRLALAQKPKKFFGFLVWEGDKIPEYWLKYLIDERVDKILVPSEHTKQAIINTFKDIGYKKDSVLRQNWLGNSIQFCIDKIEIIPHGYNPDIFFKEKIKIRDNDNLIFVANKGWSQGLYDRGGVQWTLKAFAEEFKKDEKVQLNIHINPVYNNPNWNMSDEIKKINIDATNSATCLINSDLLNNESMRNFYNEGDVFISTTMGDAFNIPCLEAMACGLPVITTRFGGQSDFVNNINGWVLEEGKLVNWSKELSYEETKWFKPDIKAIRKLMRDIYNNQKQINIKRNVALEEAKKWTWKSSAEKLSKLI